MSGEDGKAVVTLEVTGYVGVVEDFHYPDDYHNGRAVFDTPEEAGAWAKEFACSHGFTYVNWWVEYEVDVGVSGYGGMT